MCRDIVDLNTVAYVEAATKQAHVFDVASVTLKKNICVKVYAGILAFKQLNTFTSFFFVF